MVRGDSLRAVRGESAPDAGAGHDAPGVRGDTGCGWHHDEGESSYLGWLSLEAVAGFISVDFFVEGGGVEISTLLWWVYSIDSGLEAFEITNNLVPYCRWKLFQRYVHLCWRIFEEVEARTRMSSMIHTNCTVLYFSSCHGGVRYCKRCSRWEKFLELMVCFGCSFSSDSPWSIPSCPNKHFYFVKSAHSSQIRCYFTCLDYCWTLISASRSSSTLTATGSRAGKEACVRGVRDRCGTVPGAGRSSIIGRRTAVWGHWWNIRFDQFNYWTLWYRQPKLCTVVGI